jgi:hypothetical protein
VKVAESFGGNAGDTRIVQVTTAEPTIKISFDLFQQGAQFAETREIDGPCRPRPACFFDGIPLVVKLDDEFFGKRIGEAKGDEVNRFLGLQLRQIAARSGGGSHFVAPPSWRRFSGKVNKT